MGALAAVLLSAFAASPALAQADGNVAPGGIVDGAQARLNAAEGTAPDGVALPGGDRQKGAQQTLPSGGRTVGRGDSGGRAPGKAETPDKP